MARKDKRSLAMDDILTRVPPHDIEAEQSVLGAILLENGAIEQALEVLDLGNFYRESHREIFRAMSELSKRNQPIDAITIIDALRTRGKVEAIGGPAYIAELAACVPTASNVAHYARMVRDKAALRAIASTATDIASAAYDAPRDLRRFMVEAAYRIAEVTQTEPEAAGGPWAAARQIDEFLSSGEPNGDWLVDNILARESITLIAAPRGLGKTHLAYWWAILLTRRGLRGLIIDRDNPKSEIKRRLKAWGAAGLGDKLKIIARDQDTSTNGQTGVGCFSLPRV